MKFPVRVLRRAESDVSHYVRFIAERSPQGALAWLDAYEQMIERLAQRATSCGPALEDPYCNVDLKQALFKTRHGLVYRAVFTIVGKEVRVLRIRGPGQRPPEEDELT